MLSYWLLLKLPAFMSVKHLDSLKDMRDFLIFQIALLYFSLLVHRYVVVYILKYMEQCVLVG